MKVVVILVLMGVSGISATAGLDFQIAIPAFPSGSSIEGHFALWASDEVDSFDILATILEGENIAFVSPLGLLAAEWRQTPNWQGRLWSALSVPAYNLLLYWWSDAPIRLVGEFRSGDEIFGFEFPTRGISSWLILPGDRDYDFVIRTAEVPEPPPIIVLVAGGVILAAIRRNRAAAIASSCFFILSLPPTLNITI